MTKFFYMMKERNLGHKLLEVFSETFIEGYKLKRQSFKNTDFFEKNYLWTPFSSPGFSSGLRRSTVNHMDSDLKIGKN